MSTIEEMRLWMSGTAVAGFPSRDGVWDRVLPKAKIPSPTRVDGNVDINGNPLLAWDDIDDDVDDGPPKKKGIDPSKMKARKAERETGGGGTGSTTRGRGKHKMSADGTDAAILFGKHSGSRVSELALTTEGKDYLRWLIKKNVEEGGSFDDALVRVVKEHLGIKTEAKASSAPLPFETPDDDELPPRSKRDKSETIPSEEDDFGDLPF